MKTNTNATGVMERVFVKNAAVMDGHRINKIYDNSYVKTTGGFAKYKCSDFAIDTSSTLE